MKKVNLEILFIGLLFLTIITMILLILPKEIYFNFIEKEKVITLNTHYDPKLVSACYGNKFFVSHCKDISKEIKVTGSVDNTKTGNYIIVYSVEYKGKRREITQKIKVIDDDKPTIDFLGTNSVLICPNGKISEPSFLSYDNRDGNITDKTKREIQGDKYIYNVVDSSGNIATEYRKIENVDVEKPIIELLGGNNLLLELNQEYKEPGFNVYDNCSENLKDKVIISGEVKSEEEGIYFLNYSVQDEASNHIEIVRKVIVGEPKLDSNNKIVYLTFDDGPNSNTEPLLDVLKKYNVKATFFVTGQFPKYEHVLKRIHNEGHTIGVHTYSHQFKEIYASEENFYNDINKMQNIIKKYKGSETNILRFAGGSSNKVSKFNPGIMTRLTESVTSKGYVYYDWNVDSKDTQYKDSNKISQEVINHLKSKSDHFIVLQHDIKKSNIQATEQILRFGLKNGYIFQPITNETKPVHHNINN